MRAPFFTTLLFLSLFFLAASVLALENPGEQLEEVGIKPVLGASIDLGLKFTDSLGQERSLKDLFSDGNPVVLVPVYYGCPRLCGFLLNGVVDLLNKLELKIGSEYKVVTVSFDETEGPELAKARAEEYRSRISNGIADQASWQFLVGKQPSISSLMHQIGFTYQKDGKDFAHTAAIIVLTAQGQISQYFTGIEFSAWDVRLSLIDASRGSIGSMMDHALLFCFRFDPTKGKYTLAAFNVFKVGGVLTLLGLSSFIFFFARKA